MINMMIVAGSSSTNLANFMTQRGTFSVDFVFDDIHSNLDEIMHQIIKVDKLLYLYQSDDETGNANINIRADMQALQNMLVNNSFFNVGEIIFICNSSQLSAQAKRYFSAIMTECKKSNYTIKTLEGVLSFANIYDSIIGVTQAKDFGNAYRELYRVERGRESNIAYEKQNDSDLVIEPFNYDNLRNWEEQKKLASTVEHNTILSDDSTFHLDKINNPSFGQIDLNAVQIKRNVILLAGERKSGKSVWTSVLANSAKANGFNVGIFDLTHSQDLASMLEDSTNFHKVPETTALHGLCDAGAVVQCAKAELFISFLYEIVLRNVNSFDVLFVVGELKDCDTLFPILRNYLQTFIITSDLTESSIREASSHLSKLENKAVLILNGEEQIFKKNLTAEEAKSICGNVKIVKPMKFESLKAGPAFFRAIGGIEIEEDNSSTR